jgi:hypothetical protein
MHYITGTNFVVRRHANSWDSKFVLNISYSLINISNTQEGLKYLFASQRDRVEMIFESARQADGFIAAHKREQIPDYESTYQHNKSL